MADIKGAQRRLADRVIDLDGDEKCLKVMVSTDEAAQQVPSHVEGFRVVVEKTGTFRRQN